MKIFLALAFAFLMSGCAGLMGPGGLFPQSAPIPVAATLSPAAQTAQKAINEANVLLTAAANVTTDYLTQGFLTKDEARAYYLKLRDVQSKLVLAQRFLDEGLVLEATDKAALVRVLVTALHQEVAKRKAAQ
jgi:hypothetical protein